MYPEDSDGIILMIEKPAIGEKLNQPAIITFFKFGIGESEDFDRQLKKLHKWIRRNEMGFVSYD